MEYRTAISFSPCGRAKPQRKDHRPIQHQNWCSFYRMGQNLTKNQPKTNQTTPNMTPKPSQKPSKNAPSKPHEHTIKKRAGLHLLCSLSEVPSALLLAAVLHQVPCFVSVRKTLIVLLLFRLLLPPKITSQASMLGFKLISELFV